MPVFFSNTTITTTADITWWPIYTNTATNTGNVRVTNVWTDASNATVVMTWSRAEIVTPLQRDLPMLNPSPPIDGTPAPNRVPAILGDAMRRARGLLESYLTPAQRAELAQHQRITFRSASGLTIRLHRGTIGNVDVLDKDAKRVVQRLCAHPNHDLPVWDHMLAQLLHLRDPGSERAFYQIANRHPVIQRAA